MLKKLFCLFCLVVMSGGSVAGAFIVPDNPCVIDQTYITGAVDGQRVESDLIDCGDSGVCSGTLLFFVQEDGSQSLWRIIEADFYCEGEDIIVDGMRCFSQAGQLYCPLVDSQEMHHYEAEGVIYEYPDSVPVLRFSVDEK